jgi:hypothetical protein
MRIYLAARYDRRHEMRDVARRLRAAGHAITSIWIEGLHEGVPEVISAIDDWDGVAEADCVVSFTEHPTDNVSWAARGGRHVEFGIGLALGKRLCVVGPRENIFHHLSGVEVYATVAELLDGLAPKEMAS